MLSGILRGDEQQLLKEERGLLARLRAALVRFGATAENQQTLDRSIEQLDELFLIVVVGEFNAGKSAVINALLGQQVLREGVTPTTAQIHLLRFGDGVDRIHSPGRGPTPAWSDRNLHIITAPVDILREIHIVDTPGTNAILREHEALTADFVPRSDLVLFVTSADRPFTETERAFLAEIRNWGKKIVFVINKIDIFERDSELDEVVAFVQDNARKLLGSAPDIFPVSARLALRAKEGSPALWAASRFEALERYVRETLDQTSRIRLKLLNPLGVGVSLTQRYVAAARERSALLKEDFAALDDVERQLRVYEADMTRDFEFRMADIEKILLEMERRGHAYFDETMRIGRVMDLLNRSRVQQGFETEVVADTPQQIERKVGELIDWLVDADFKQWQAVMSYLAERRRQYKDRIVGAEADSFHFDRTRLIDSVGRDAQRVVETFDKRQEASELADRARDAVATAAAVGAGAVGLGTIVTLAASTAAADVTGIVLASVVAAIGFFVIPSRRQKGKREMAAKIGELRERLGSALRTHFEEELRRSGARIREGIAPYSRFVRAEGEKLAETERELQQITTDLERLRASVDRLAAA
jgi:small GTP-binding protein